MQQNVRREKKINIELQRQRIILICFLIFSAISMLFALFCIFIELWNKNTNQIYIKLIKFTPNPINQLTVTFCRYFLSNKIL